VIPTPAGFRLRGRAALALTALALAACLAAIIGIAWPFSDRTPIPIVLLDRSASVSGDSAGTALQALLSELHARYEIAEADVIEFDDFPSSAVRVTTAGTGQPELASAPTRNGTNLAAALEQAIDLASSAEGPPRPVFVIGDGYATRGSTTAALRAAAAAGIVPHWIPTSQGRSIPRIGEILLPDRAGLGERIEVLVRIAGVPNEGSAQRVSITTVNPGGDAESAAAEVSGEGVARLSFAPRAAGPVLLNVALQDAADGTVLDERPLAAVIEVMPAADLLYVGGSDAALARSLVAGRWSLDVVSPRALSGLHEQLGAYSAVILDEVPVAAADQRLWDSLLEAVRSEGTGLLVLGGSTAFAAGGYRGSTLESALPVLSEPAALRESTAVVFAVDKSGSMGEGTAGIDRFQLARQAVLETVADMSEADRVALVAFDVEARTLLEMSEATRARRDLSGAWPVRAAGGTSLVPALEAAMAQFEPDGEDRRLLVLVTDGFLDDVPIDAWRRRLEAAGVELLAFAIGPDARLDELRRLAGTSGGGVIRVEQAAELPGLMRSTVERQRAVIERGTIQLRPLVPVDFVESGDSAWPDIEAYTVTRAREDATVTREIPSSPRKPSGSVG